MKLSLVMKYFAKKIAVDLRHVNNSSLKNSEKMIENILQVICRTLCTCIYIWKNSNFKAKYILGKNLKCQNMKRLLGAFEKEKEIKVKSQKRCQKVLMVQNK